MLALGALLLVLADAPQPRLLRPGAGQEPATMLWAAAPTTPWGTFPVSRRDPPSIERMARRIAPSRLLRVRARQGIFVGRVASVRTLGLMSLTPDTTRSWAGPIDVLAWEDIQTIEVRRRSPPRTTVTGAVFGTIAGAITAYAYTQANGGDDFAALFIFGLGGALAGGTVGFGVGCAIPIWEPLYHQP